MLNQMKKTYSQWCLHCHAHGLCHPQDSRWRPHEGEEHWQLHLGLKENNITWFGFSWVFWFFFFPIYPKKQFSKHKPIVKFDSYSHYHDSNSTGDT